MPQSSRRIAVTVLSWFTLMIWTLSAWARPELGPPSIKLRTNVSNVTVVELLEKRNESKLLFHKVADLHNEAPEQFELQFNGEWADQLAVGERYIVAYIAWRVDRFPKVLKPRDDGPVLISLPGAAPAVFSDSELLREILAWPLEDSLQSPAALLPLIREGLSRDDWQYQAFFVTEIAMRPDLHAQLTTADREMIAALAENPGTTPYVPQFLFYQGDFLADAYSQQRRVAFAQRLLKQMPLHLDTASLYPQLVRTAMHYLGEKGMPDSHSESDRHQVTLARWLKAGQPALVESAMEAMRKLEVDALPELIDAALRQTFVSAATRQVLTNYRRRLQAIRQQGGGSK